FVSIDAKNAPLETVLEQCFKNQPITYEIVDKTIIVKPRPLVTASTAVAPPVVVSGTVTDENGQAMPGVGIALKGTRTATVSNERGEYTISIPEEAAASAVLVFTYIGYERQEIPLNGRTSISIKLTPDLQSLNEVVV